jgi:hypothetical protein
MDSIFDPILAILAIIVPLGLAYVVIQKQVCKSLDVFPNLSAMTRKESPQEESDLSSAEKKQAARLMMYWLF